MTEVPTTEAIRAKIDSGATGEKVGFPDPAAAPLGTDAEASGNTPTVEERRMEAASQPHIRPQRPMNGPLIYAGILAIVIALIWLVALSV